VRVLLDTNVIVSAVTTRGLCADVFRIVLAAHELVTCAKVLQEVRRILGMKFDVPEQLIAEYLELIGQDAIVAEPEDLPDLPIQDRDDAAIVAAAIAAGAQVLVTGDHELQSLKNVGKVSVLSPRAFWEELTACVWASAALEKNR
jgi:putative PIN family toxin of toxin-antitoxin system